MDLATSLWLGQSFLFIRPILLAQHSAVDIEHRPRQETSESSHIHMAVRGTSLQFFHFSFFLEIFKKEGGKKVSLRVCQPCLLLLHACSQLENKDYLSCWISLAQGGLFAITPGMALR